MLALPAVTWPAMGSAPLSSAQAGRLPNASATARRLKTGCLGCITCPVLPEHNLPQALAISAAATQVWLIGFQINR
ncbi:hypothetical protein GALL_444250 [mine drainage metagenome]|uniref:Uncharacterized protein n=1 Tax=mine drainage metagenome TaxID=410659 RepID=A0A1J5PQR2_9ZZZZ